MEIFEDSSPFIYDEGKDSIVYRGDFGHLNPDAIMPESEEWIDGLRIAKVTTWSHETGPENESASGYNTNAPLKDSIDFVFWGKMWLPSPKVQIAVFKTCDEPSVDFNIRMRDYKPADTYPRHVKAWDQIYNMALEGVDANDTSL